MGEPTDPTEAIIEALAGRGLLDVTQRQARKLCGKFKRPSYQRLLTDLAAGEIDENDVAAEVIRMFDAAEGIELDDLTMQQWAEIKATMLPGGVDPTGPSSS